MQIVDTKINRFNCQLIVDWLNAIALKLIFYVDIINVVRVDRQTLHFEWNNHKRQKKNKTESFSEFYSNLTRCLARYFKSLFNGGQCNNEI